MKIKMACWVMGVAACVAFPVFADDLYVDVEQTTNTADGTTWKTAFTNIQDAVNVAGNGDTIWVAAGIYTPISTSNKIITIESIEGPAATVIEGVRVLWTNDRVAGCATLGVGLNNTTNTVLTGFTLRNGDHGGFWAGGVSGGTLNNCVVSNNMSDYVGGAYGSTLNNCLLVRNSGRRVGASFFSTLNNCTVWGNFGADAGGAASGILNNCIVQGNGWDNITNSSIYFSHIGGKDPQLEDPHNGDYRLVSTSVCIGAGDVEAVVVDVDMFGAPMVVAGKVNQGALAEPVEAVVRVVPTTADVPPAGTSDLTFTIQTELEWTVACDDDWILISPPSGTGNGMVDISVAENTSDPRTATVRVSCGTLGSQTAYFYVVQEKRGPVTFYVDEKQVDTPADGLSWETAFPDIQLAVDVATRYCGDTIRVADGTYSPIRTGSKQLVIQSMNGADVTIIDGGGSNRCATLRAEPVKPDTVLTGFTLQNGWAGYGGGAIGGILNNCIITRNTCIEIGGGAYGSVLNNCILSNNDAAYYGGGVYGCTGNNCLFIGNTTLFGGGGACYSTLNNCVVWGNRVSNGNGGGVDDAWLNNSIVFGNAVNSGAAANHSGSTFNYSCTMPLPEGTYDGGGNIAADPLFVNAAAGDFHLQSDSPCQNAGHPSHVAVAADMDGNPLVVNGFVSMGAFAGIAPQVTSQGVEYRWLELHKLASGSDPQAYEDAALDTSYKGYPVWHDYVAGNNPTNTDEVLRIYIGNEDDSTAVWWNPHLIDDLPPRIYELKGTTNLTDSTSWSNNLDAARFFRVEVWLRSHPPAPAGP